MAAAARGFAGRLHEAGLRKGDTVLFWGENRPEWIVAFWGCVLAGVVVVPDRLPVVARRSRGASPRSSAPAIALVGDDVPAVERRTRSRPTRWAGSPPGACRASTGRTGARAPRVGRSPRDDVAEIIFTSGATAEPKGVVITHRNVLANIVPIEREVLKYRRWGRPFFPLRFLNLLPLSHMFGQAMATFIPPMLPGTVVFMRGYNPAEIVAQVKRRRVSVLVSVPKILDVLARARAAGDRPRRPTAPAAARARRAALVALPGRPPRRSA